MKTQKHVTVSDVTHTSNTHKEADVTLISDWNGNLFHIQLDRRPAAAGVAIPQQTARIPKPSTSLKLDPAKLAEAQAWASQITRDLTNA